MLATISSELTSISTVLGLSVLNANPKIHSLVVVLALQFVASVSMFVMAAPTVSPLLTASRLIMDRILILSIQVMSVRRQLTVFSDDLSGMQI